MAEYSRDRPSQRRYASNRQVCMTDACSYHLDEQLIISDFLEGHILQLPLTPLYRWIGDDSPGRVYLIVRDGGHRGAVCFGDSYGVGFRLTVVFFARVDAGANTVISTSPSACSLPSACMHRSWQLGRYSAPSELHLQPMAVSPARSIH